MSEKSLRRLLLIEAGVCVLLAAAARLWPSASGASELLSGVLAALPKAGRFGFAVGLTAAAAVVLLPLYTLARVGKRRALEWEDALLPAASVAAGVTLWFGCAAGAKSALAYVTWLGQLLSLLAAYLVLRLLRRFREGGTEELLNDLRLLLCCAAAYFVLTAAFFGGYALLTRLSALSGGTAQGVCTGVVLVLRALAAALPQCCAAVTVVRALPLLDALHGGKLTGEAAQSAHTLAQWCHRALRMCVLATLAVNALQTLAYGLLTDIRISVDVPVFELCFVLLALLGARLVETAAQLQAESDLIV